MSVTGSGCPGLKTGRHESARAEQECRWCRPLVSRGNKEAVDVQRSSSPPVPDVSRAPSGANQLDLDVTRLVRDPDTPPEALVRAARSADFVDLSELLSNPSCPPAAVRVVVDRSKHLPGLRKRAIEMSGVWSQSELRHYARSSDEYAVWGVACNMSAPLWLLDEIAREGSGRPRLSAIKTSAEIRTQISTKFRTVSNQTVDTISRMDWQNLDLSDEAIRGALALFG